MFSFCMTLCILLDVDDVFFYKLNVDCIFYLVVMDELILARLSLLWARVVMTNDVSMPIATRSYSSDECFLPIPTELPL
jgi:hypothetical protein